MVLGINTIKNNNTRIEVYLKKNRSIISTKTLSAKYRQAEKLLPAIELLLDLNKSKLSDIKCIEVVNHGGSFTSLRIGVVTANALGYSLGVPVIACDKEVNPIKKSKIKKWRFNIIDPEYDGEPNITISKKIL